MGGAIKPWHIIVLVVVLILLFGAKRLPDAARGLRRSLRILKAETAGLHDDVNAKAEPKPGRESLAAQTPGDQASPLHDVIQPGYREHDKIGDPPS
jgi:sec-independent protein translocase protein TatA